MRATNTATRMARTAEFRQDSASVPTVRLLYDTTGKPWVEIAVPIDVATARELRIMAQNGIINLEEYSLPEADFRAVEMAWIQAHRAELVATYPGQWIAVDGPQLIAHAGSLVDLLKKARDTGHPNPFVTAIPAEPIGSLALCAM